jgi:hypothetical protein
MEVCGLLEYYMRCEGGNIQDKMPERAGLGNMISLPKMPLNTIQRYSGAFTHPTPNFFPFPVEMV